MLFDHIDHLILAVARDHKFVNFLLLLDFASHEKVRYLLVVDDTLADG